MAARIYPLDENWPSLKKMEEEAILQIITGAKPLDYFDEFVQMWYDSGGTALLEKINRSNLCVIPRVRAAVDCRTHLIY